jgi:hypothetical protein
METKCAALVVRTLLPRILRAATSAVNYANTAPQGHSEHCPPCVILHRTLLPMQAANRHDAAELAAKQVELAALQAEAARLSSSNTAQAEHEARFRTAAERCAALAGSEVLGFGFAAACIPRCALPGAVHWCMLQ